MSIIYKQSCHDQQQSRSYESNTQLAIMMTLPLIHIENKINTQVLTNEASSVLFPLSEENKVLITKMKETLYELGGVGLAAPQVNVSKKIIAIYIPDHAVLLRDNAIPYPMHILINPSYTGIQSSGQYADIEACYSVKTKAGKVQRYKAIVLTYQDENGHKQTNHEYDFYARVLQHEIDHLNGLLITDRLTPSDVQGSLQAMMNLRSNELSDEKKKLFDQLMIQKKMEGKAK